MKRYFIITSLLEIIVILYALGFLSNFITSFVKDFSFKKFSQISQGMKKQEVYKIIGRPLVYTNEKSICEFYSKEGKSFGLGSWIGWRQIGVCYDPVGKVTEKINNLFFR